MQWKTSRQYDAASLLPNDNSSAALSSATISALAPFLDISLSAAASGSSEDISLVLRITLLASIYANSVDEKRIPQTFLNGLAP
jgi:hypothetical protein